jgi:hypothetical protein
MGAYGRVLRHFLYFKGQQMNAFYSDGKTLIKAYANGNDWQLIDSDGNERWFSIWHADKYASLVRAFHDFLGKDGKFASSNIVSVKG